MPIVYLSLGSNIDDRRKHISDAENQIGSDVGHITASSHLYETEPWGTSHPEWFLNKTISVETILKPLNILEKIKKIEKNLGRTLNKEKYSPRTIDIDILFIGNLIFNGKDLVVPHPFICERKFVLEPLSEIAGSFVHPVLNKPVGVLLHACTDSCKVKRIF
jgi:2-amino-4-hydroxy-6-hydroxymethyldihydropteridine diphosphokinase